jgi:hypothetical protein
VIIGAVVSIGLYGTRIRVSRRAMLEICGSAREGAYLPG